MPDPAPAMHPFVPRPFRVRRKWKETPDAVSFDLDPVDGPPLQYLPGQFNMLYAFGIGEVPISISSADEPSKPLRHTVRAVGAVSRALCQVRRGDVIGVRGPFGNSWLDDSHHGADLVIMGGGIGLAPLRGALLQALRQRDRFGRIFLLVGARTPEDILFRAELDRLAARDDVNLMVTVDRAGRDWTGDVGVVTTLLGRIAFDPASTVALVCGPEIMMRLSASALADYGIPTDRIRVSLERNMRCAIGWCGHCQLGSVFICRDGAVFPFEQAAQLLAVRER